MTFSVHQKVQHRLDPAKVGTIESIGQCYAGEQYYRVFWGGASGTTSIGERNLQEYAEILTPYDSLAAGVLGGYSDLQRIITLQRIVRDDPLRNNVYAFNASRTRFFPYQFKPLLKFLSSPRNRLLICDEVGLGKTIEAGLILLELRARQTLRRVLVICPSNLRNKWHTELRTRFSEDFRVLATADVLRFLDEYAEEPERTRMAGIVSLETLRGDRVRARIAELEPSFDVLLIDEAHHLRNFNTIQREVASTLCQSAHSVVMLTATPIQLGDENLYSLLNLLDERDFPSFEVARERFNDNEWIVRAQSALHRNPPELSVAAAQLHIAETTAWQMRRETIRAIREAIERAAAEVQSDGAPLNRSRVIDLQRDVSELNLLGSILTRTRKRDVQVDAPVRRAKAIRLQFNSAEQAFYDAATNAIRKGAETFEGNASGQAFRLLMPQRRLASSIAGMVEFYRDDARDDADVDSEETFDDLVMQASAPDSHTASQLRSTLAGLARQWTDGTPDSKYDAFTALLAELRTSDRVNKVVVFATFLHTLRYVERRLMAAGVGVVRVAGDVADMNERTRLIEKFRDDATVEVLLSSRVGTEGLDFQFCSVLVNYDLPWNPMEVEQRIGRLDRIGQQEKSILICNFWIADTIEERILARLYDRIGIFARSIGDLEAILGDVVSALQAQLLVAALDPTEALVEANRLADVIENRSREIDRLEVASAQFVGADSFFDDEVSAIRTQRRYVTAEQLRRFVVEFLRLKAPRSRLEYDEASHIGRLTPDAEVLRLLRKTMRTGEATAILSAPDSGVAITFDAQTAYTRPRLEFINVLHPLVSAIVSEYTFELPAASAQHVRVKSATVPAGFYFYFVFRARLRSARSFSSLECVVVTEDLKVLADGELAEQLLGEIVERGESGLDAVEFPPDLAQRAALAAEMAFLRRLTSLEEGERRINDAFVEQRLESVRSFHGKVIDRVKMRLVAAERAQKQDRYKIMLRGQIANRQSEMARESEALAHLRNVASDHVSIAAGILEVFGE